ncbi:primase-helicase family protein [Niveibacterium sp. SC-1]|uniref:primase-helicase family protein n=1 Tax=Niveibacterium sp. SC-1 TaxID=3135646 RepID=UPI00311E7426
MATRTEPPAPSSAEPDAKGGGGRKKKEKPIDWGGFSGLMGRFVLIYGTDTVFDTQQNLLMKIGAMRLAFGTDLVKLWQHARDRRQILPDGLVFNPAGVCGTDQVNLFTGFAMKPKEGDCAPLLELLYHLCGRSADTPEGVQQVVEWVLRWLALPLQRPGAKMQSALVFHGKQGAGKNLFFEAVAQIYGRYAIVVGQDELEDKFNDWASQKLMAIGDEVVARAELFHQKNKLKKLITGETVQINPKNMPRRTEANSMNVVFLSNETQPLALEEGDRRYLVVYTPPAAQPELYQAARRSLDQGAVQALYHYLLTLDLGDFDVWTKPLMTTAKRDLIELGLKPAERFAAEWLEGYLPLPVQVCSNVQLYRAFLAWCRRNGERFPPPQSVASSHITKWAEERLDLRVVKLPAGHQKCLRVWIPEGCRLTGDKTLGEWAAEGVEAFEKHVARFCGGGDAVEPT